MSIVSTGKGSYRSRLNKMVHAAAYTGCETFPYGRSYMYHLVSLTKEQRTDLIKFKEAREADKLADMWTEESDKRFAWFAGALLVIVYASLEVGLQMYLLGLSW